MRQLLFINNLLSQHVSDIIMPIFRSARPYFTAYGFQHLMCWLVSWEAVREHTDSKIGLALLKMGIMMPETC